MEKETRKEVRLTTTTTTTTLHSLVRNFFLHQHLGLTSIFKWHEIRWEVKFKLSRYFLRSKICSTAATAVMKICHRIYNKLDKLENGSKNSIVVYSQLLNSNRVGCQYNPARYQPSLTTYVGYQAYNMKEKLIHFHQRKKYLFSQLD